MLRFIGSPAFAAITSHKNKSQSRKDDLEALFYVLFYFTTGELPWGKAALIEDKTKVMEAILKIKTNAFADGEYNGIPKSLLQFYNYVMALDYSETPNYEKLK